MSYALGWAAALVLLVKVELMSGRLILSFEVLLQTIFAILAALISQNERFNGEFPGVIDMHI